ncbi:hypothetical protein VTK73DRAFT_9078 [Phialemonium thermophilum]|uniref:Meiotic recombination protein DMC1 n=1 Tax=Phialemonium thermophilum TaxID=223376 RepID=A0ABR3W4R7_9PEZI
MADTHPQSAAAASATAGGFIPETPLPPSQSDTSAKPSPRTGDDSLPHPRGRPLRPGSAKEEKVRRYLEERLLYISRRYVKKYSVPEPGDTIVGYKSIAELCRDLGEVINILWLSGTPSLQIPYLLNIAGEFLTWLASFAPSPTATFPILRKLDHCFASLLSGRDISTGERLPGFDGPDGGHQGMSRTDMVRCKSLAEQTRVLVVELLSREPEEEEEGDDEDGEDEKEEDAMEATEDTRDGGRGGGPGHGDADGDRDLETWFEDDEELDMDAACVYENTLVKLGETLGDDGEV